MKFKEWVEGPLTALIQPDPDAKRVDFSKVEWLKSNKAWSPKFEASLADNGVVHKEQIRFRTPNLNTLRDAG
jgi:phenol hydroxylase P4 protein